LVPYRSENEVPNLPRTVEELTSAIANGSIGDLEARKALYLIVAKEQLGAEATDGAVDELAEELGGLLAEVPLLDALLMK
jgi:hypothetical protein